MKKSRVRNLENYLPIASAQDKDQDVILQLKCKGGSFLRLKDLEHNQDHYEKCPNIFKWFFEKNSANLLAKDNNQQRFLEKDVTARCKKGD